MRAITHFLGAFQLASPSGIYVAVLLPWTVVGRTVHLQGLHLIPLPEEERYRASE
jgi:hypothetical protein